MKEWLWESIVLACSLAVPPRANADLRFQQCQANAGDVATGGKLVHHFHFVNDGPQRIVICKLQRSCGCLEPNVIRKEYGPGEEGSLDLEVNTLTQGGGVHIWTLDVEYLDGTSPRRQRLELTARMIPQITVEPATLIVHAERAADHKILVTDRRPKHLLVTGIRTSCPNLAAHLSNEYEIASGHWQAEIELAATGAPFDGRLSAEIIIYTDDPANSELRLPVTVLSHAGQRVSAVPEDLEFAAMGSRSVPSRMVRLREVQGQPVLIDHILVDHSSLICTFAEGPGAQATVKVRIDPSHLVNKHLETAIHIHLRSPRDQIVTVPIRIDLN